MDALKPMCRDPPALTGGNGKAEKAKENELDSNSEEPQNPPNTVLQSAAAVLCPAGTHIEFTNHPDVARVKTNAAPVKTVGFIKITNAYELEAFDRIRNSGCKFLLDHVVLPTKSVEMHEETVIFLPYGGETLHTRNIRIGPMMGYELPIAVDILKIFSHLHEIRIAHLDIKPSNILWDRSSRTVRVIDFDSSWTFEPGESSMITGDIGTRAYLAPEVVSFGGEREYDAFLADAYGCGRVLEEMMEDALQSDAREFVCGVVAESLMKQVRRRWTIPKALEELSSYVEKRNARKGSEHTASQAAGNLQSDCASATSDCAR